MALYFLANHLLLLSIFHNVFKQHCSAFFRGVLLQRQNRLTEAIQAYKKAIHFRPKLICKSIFQVFVIVLPQQYSCIHTSYIYLLLNIFHSSFIATVFAVQIALTLCVFCFSWKFAQSEISINTSFTLCYSFILSKVAAQSVKRTKWNRTMWGLPVMEDWQQLYYVSRF